MKFTTEQLPLLPFGMHPRLAWFDGRLIHLICSDDHVWFDYSWDGVSATYTGVQTNLKVVIDEI